MAEISRADAAALLREMVGPRILEKATEDSVALSTCTTVPMTTKTGRQSMANTLPVAGFTGGDAAPAKPISEMSWVSKDLIAEEIAVIVPIFEDALDDSANNVLAMAEAACGQAIGAALDGAVFSGIGKPTSWPEGLIPAAIAAGQTVELTDFDAADETSGVVGATNEAMALVENLGYDAGQFWAPKSNKSKLRGLRNADGDLIYVGSLSAGGAVNSLWGSAIDFLPGPLWTATGSGEYLTGDPSLIVVGVRANVDVKVFDSGVIHDPSDGTVVSNLMQDDMIAIRVKARFGFNYGAVATLDNPTATKTPFALVIDAA